MRLLALTAAAVFVLDRITKAVVQARMALGESIPVVPGVFHLSYVRNPGAAFGLFPDRTAFFVVATVLVVGLILWYAWRVGVPRRPVRLALGLQLGGALGNLVDRATAGTVVDFLDFRVWPVFNLADTAIVIGVGIFALEVVGAMLREGRA